MDSIRIHTLVVSDPGAALRDGVRVTYLGTNGYQFEFGGHALLVDPYFSRVDLLSVALGSRIQPNASRINVRRFQAHYPNWKFRYGMRDILEEIHPAVAESS